MEIIYKNKEIEKICTDLKEARKKLNSYSIDLIAKINLIKNATSFSDIQSYQPFHCHKLHGNRKNYWSLDIKSRKCQWRLIIAPLDENHNIITTKFDFFKQCNQVTIILVEEVSKHYE